MMAAKAKGQLPSHQSKQHRDTVNRDVLLGRFQVQKHLKLSKASAGHHTEFLDSTKVTPLVHNCHRPSKYYT